MNNLVAPSKLEITLLKTLGVGIAPPLQRLVTEGQQQATSGSGLEMAPNLSFQH